MIFPVHATVTTPGFRPHHGLAEEVTAAGQAKKLEKDVKDIAIKAAAANMSLQIGLMFIPVVGWALGAVVALVQFFTGKHYEQRVKDVIAKTGDAVRAKAASANQEVSLAASQVYDQEYRSAVTLAASGAPLGDFWSDAKDSAVKAFKKAAPIVRKISMAPVTLVVKGSRAVTSAGLKVVASASDSAGADGFARDVRKFEEKGDKIAADIEYRTEDPKRAHELLSGKEMLNVAENRAADLKATAFKEIDRQKAEAIAKITSAEGRSIIRTETARALRGDPETLARVAQLNAEQATLKAQLNADNAAANAAVASMIPTVPPAVSQMNSTTAILDTALAAGAAFLAFR